MVDEPWLVRLGNQMSANLKHALMLQSSSKPLTKNKPEIRNKTIETIGILSFEVANVMSKTVHLHKSLTNPEISRLKNEILKSDGVKTLVSSDETYLLDLALSEKLDDLNFIAGVVSRLGKKCTVQHLQGFEHVYGDIVSGSIDVNELGFLVKDMDAMVRRMERFVNATARLYTEMEVLSELESATNKFHQNLHEENRKVFEQKVIWQKQHVKHLKNISLWNQTYDKTVEMLARTVCTLYSRICLVFIDSISRRKMFSNSYCTVDSNCSRKNINIINHTSFKTGQKNRLVVHASENTIGGSALSLHYANVIIVIEKLLKYPHLVSEEVRVDLYQMLPATLRLALEMSLKSYMKDLSIYDAPLARDWKDRVDEILGFLAPLAHNMMRWQNERNFEQQQIVSRTNVLLLQTLYFADRIKTETAICELLVGLNYICRYEHQQHAFLDCESSFNIEDCMEW